MNAAVIIAMQVLAYSDTLFDVDVLCRGEGGY